MTRELYEQPWYSHVFIKKKHREMKRDYIKISSLTSCRRQGCLFLISQSLKNPTLTCPKA